jgi:molybdate transport system ATP-binding protein
VSGQGLSPAPPGALAIDVCKGYGARPGAGFELLSRFEAGPGVTVVVGPSGAGKTTLLRCIAGLCDPSRGRVAIGERLLFDSARKVNLPPSRRRVGFVFQELALFPHLTVEENVGYGLRRLDARERERRQVSILESFQIAHLRRRLPRQTSGGEQQRVALARSLVTEPDVLLLDEPLASLDAGIKVAIIDDLHRWNQARCIPILYVTHDYDEVLALGDRVISLERGRIAAQGAPLDVMTAPRREPMRQTEGFDNLFEAVVVGGGGREGSMRCRLARSAVELELPLTRVPEGAGVRVGIRASEILLAAAPPAIVGACNVVRGRVQRLDGSGSRVTVRVDGGAEFLVQLPGRGSAAGPGLPHDAEAWMIIRESSCHLVRSRTLNAVQRLFVFICNRNTSRSPMAQAICNAEIARRLRVPLHALAQIGVQASSAGLSATPGEPMSAAAREALSQLGVPVLEHRARNLTAELAARAEAIFCMTSNQRERTIQLFPEAAAKVACLAGPEGADLEEPSGHGEGALVQLAMQIQALVRQCLDAAALLPE